MDCKIQADIIGVYRSIALIVRLWDSACASALIPWTKGITYWLVVLALFAAIKFLPILPLVLYPCLPITGIIFLFEILIAMILMSAIYTSSHSLQQNSKHVKHSDHKRMEEFRKIVHSLRPLRCRMGQFYFIEKDTPLVVVSLVLDQLISLLIAF